jgi:NAD(P)-dependent dehydrogenase (short-subunit alcohol dehydrogenase family)
LIPFISDFNALIIGATRGLGYALADTAIERHHIRVICLGRTATTSGTLRRGAYNVEFDVTKTESWGKALEAVIMYRPAYVVWNAGIFDRRPFVDQTDTAIDEMIDTHLRGPMKFLNRLHRLQMHQSPMSDRPGKPYHLIVVASTSSYKLRDNEALYCALKSAKAAFARQFAFELLRDLPGQGTPEKSSASKVTLINPVGMKTGMLAAIGQDTSKMMDPFAVAEIIWREALKQESCFEELNIYRDADGTPRIEFGAKTPQSPF